MKKLHIVTAAGMLMCGSSVAAYNPWADMRKHMEDMEKSFDQMHKDMQAAQERASKMFESAKSADASRYSLDANMRVSRDGRSEYVVTAGLPDFGKDDIKLKVEVKENRSGRPVKSLEISKNTANDQQESDEKKVVKKDSEKRSTVHYSSSMSSSMVLNGFGKTVSVENGVLTMTIDLPSNADENDWTFDFDDEKKVLTVVFNTVTQPKTKVIERTFKDRG